MLGSQVLVLQNLPHGLFIQISSLLHLFHPLHPFGGNLISQVRQVEDFILIDRFQEGDGGGNGQGQRIVVHPVAYVLGSFGEADDPVELAHLHAHLLGQLFIAVQLLRLEAPLLLPARLLLHALHLHPQGAGEVEHGNMGPVEVAVRHQDFRVRIGNLLDNGGDGIIQLRGDQVAALAGEDFQGALFSDPGENGVLHAVQLDGLFQLLVVLAPGVHGNGVVLGLLQIGGVQEDKESLVLFGAGNIPPGLLIRGNQTLVKHLGNGGSGRSLGGGSPHNSRGEIDCISKFRRQSIFGPFSRNRGGGRLRLLGLRCLLLLLLGGFGPLGALGRLSLLGLLAGGGGRFRLLGLRRLLLLLLGGFGSLGALGRLGFLGLLAGSGGRLRLLGGRDFLHLTLGRLGSLGALGGLGLLGLLAGGGGRFRLLGLRCLLLLLLGGFGSLGALGRLGFLGLLAGSGGRFRLLGLRRLLLLLLGGFGSLGALGRLGLLGLLARGRVFRSLEVGLFLLFAIGSRLHQPAGDRNSRFPVCLPVILDGLLQTHFVHQGGNVLLFHKLASPLAPVAGDKLVLAVLPEPEDHRLLHPARLDAGDKAAVGLVRLPGNGDAGQIVDFCQGDVLRLGDRGVSAVFVCHKYLQF